MKIFISQPMNGKTDTEIKTERLAAIEKIEEVYGNDVEIVDSIITDAPDGAKPLWYLGKSLQMLSEADGVYFMKGYESARGCIIEWEACHGYDIPVIGIGDYLIKTK